MVQKVGFNEIERKETKSEYMGKYQKAVEVIYDPSFTLLC